MSLPTQTEKSKHQGIRSVLAGTIGTVIEYYDFTLYATATALVFNKVFFPNDSAVVGTLAAFATFFVGYLARPLGGIIFGHFGDRIGRKRMLILTILIMGFGTFAIGLVPSYNAIGVWAPILLLALRLLQGIGIGGEYGGGVLIAFEHAEPHKRGLAGSLVNIGVPAGFLVPIAFLDALSNMPSDQFLSWGWRIPFFFSLVLVALGVFIRLRVLESPDFEQSKKEEGVAKLPIVEVLHRHWQKVVLGIGAKIAESGLFNIYAVFAISYAVITLKVPKSAVLNAVLLGCLVECFTLPSFGWLSDRIGRVPVYVGSAIFQAILAFVFFKLADGSGLIGITIAIILGLGFGHGSIYGAQAAFFAEAFPARVRYTGLSLVEQVGPILGGGLSPLVATALFAKYAGDTLPISLYMAGIAALSGICAIVLGWAYTSHRLAYE
jgi:MFS family permease